MTGTTHRPNESPILDAMRDDDIAHDPWGTAMAWAFAVCEVLTFEEGAGNLIPHEMGYRPSPISSTVDMDSYPDCEVVEMALTVEQLTTAAKCLSRYLDWLKAAHLDY